MRTYIARGSNAWNAATNKTEAVIRIMARGVSLDKIALVSTEGRATVDWNGSVNSTQSIRDEQITFGELADALYDRMTDVQEVLAKLLEDDVLATKDFPTVSQDYLEEATKRVGDLVDHPMSDLESNLLANGEVKS